MPDDKKVTDQPSKKSVEQLVAMSQWREYAKGDIVDPTKVSKTRLTELREIGTLVTKTEYVHKYGEEPNEVPADELTKRREAIAPQDTRSASVQYQKENPTFRREGSQ